MLWSGITTATSYGVNIHSPAPAPSPAPTPSGGGGGGQNAGPVWGVFTSDDITDIMDGLRLLTTEMMLFYKNNPTNSRFVRNVQKQPTTRDLTVILAKKLAAMSQNDRDVLIDRIAKQLQTNTEKVSEADRLRIMAILEAFQTQHMPTFDEILHEVIDNYKSAPVQFWLTMLRFIHNASSKS